MCSRSDAIEEVEHHAENMPHRQHRYNAVASLDTYHATAILYVGEQAAIGEHHTFTVTRSARGVIDEGQLLTLFATPMNILPEETARIFTAEQFVQVSRA